MAKKKQGKRNQKNASRQGKRKNQANKPKKRVEAPYPHFRYSKKSKHPALIVGEQKRHDERKGREIDEYKFRKVMHGEREGGKTNETIYPNPDPNDPDPMRIAKRVRHDEKDYFELFLLPWEYPKKK